MKRVIHKIAFFLPLFLACAIAEAQRLFDTSTDWLRYTSVSFALPFTSWEYNVDSNAAEYIPSEFESNGYTFDYQTYHISPKKDFAVLIRCGFGGWSGSYVLTSDSSSVQESDGEEEGENTTDELSGFIMYFKVGCGKAFYVMKKRLVIVPTAGLGVDAYILSNAEDVFEVYEGDTKTASLSYSTYDFTLDVFLNVMAAFMISEHFGLCASFELSFPAVGANIYRVGDGSTDISGTRMIGNFSATNFMPAVGICLRL